MFDRISFKTKKNLAILPEFSFKYSHNQVARQRSLVVVYAEDEHDCIVFSDRELPSGNTYEIRGDGIWADINCEIENEHWSFSMESFALRVPIDDYLAFVESRESLLIGDRVPFGFELDIVSTANDEWFLSGDVFVEKNEIELAELNVEVAFK